MTDHSKTEKKLRQLRHVVAEAIGMLEDCEKPHSPLEKIRGAAGWAKVTLKIALDETEP